MMISVYWSSCSSSLCVFACERETETSLPTLFALLKHYLPQPTVKQLRVAALAQVTSTSSEAAHEDSHHLWPHAIMSSHMEHHVDSWRQPRSSSVLPPCPSVWPCWGSPTFRGGQTGRWSSTSEVSNTTSCCQTDRTCHLRRSQCGRQHLQYLFFDCFSVFYSNGKLWCHYDNKTRRARSLEMLLGNEMKH